MKPEDAVNGSSSSEEKPGCGAVPDERALSGLPCGQSGPFRRVRQYSGGFEYVIGGRMECAVDSAGRTTYRFIK